MNRKYPCKRVEKKTAANSCEQLRTAARSCEQLREVNPNFENSNNTPILQDNPDQCPYCLITCKKKNLHNHFRKACGKIPENKRIYYIEKYNNNKRHQNFKNQLAITNNTTNNNTNIKNNNCHNITNSHNTTNIQNNNNILNNITIKINPFGQENLNTLSKTDIFRLINRAYKMIPDTIKAIHYNIQENRNMYIPNVNRPLVKVFNGEEWVYKSLDYVTQIVSDNIKDNLEEWTNKYDKRLSPCKKKALNEFVSKCIDGKMETLFKDELKMFLMTYSNELKDFLNSEISNNLETFTNNFEIFNNDLQEIN